jgi:hypothetical protein
MTKSEPSSPTGETQRTDGVPVLDGVVLDPLPTYEEIETFLHAHGRKLPRPKVYRSFESALRAIVRAETK